MADNKQLVDDFLDASRRGDTQRMAALLHSDFCVYEADSLPYAGEHRGLEGFLALVKRVFTSFRDTRVDIRQMLAEGDTVVVLATLSGRSKHNGEAFQVPVNEVWEFAEGRILRITPYYFDTARLVALAGGAA